MLKALRFNCKKLLLPKFKADTCLAIFTGCFSIEPPDTSIFTQKTTQINISNEQ